MECFSPRHIKDKQNLSHFESCKHVVILVQNYYSKMTVDLREALRDSKIICNRHVDGNPQECPNGVIKWKP